MDGKKTCFWKRWYQQHDPEWTCSDFPSYASLTINLSTALNVNLNINLSTALNVNIAVNLNINLNVNLKLYDVTVYDTSLAFMLKWVFSKCFAFLLGPDFVFVFKQRSKNYIFKAAHTISGSFILYQPKIPHTHLLGFYWLRRLRFVNARVHLVSRCETKETAVMQIPVFRTLHPFPFSALTFPPGEFYFHLSDDAYSLWDKWSPH